MGSSASSAASSWRKAASTPRSAATMSGRRSSSDAGTPAAEAPAGADRRPPLRSRQPDSVRATLRGRAALRRTIPVPVRARSWQSRAWRAYRPRRGPSPCRLGAGSSRARAAGDRRRPLARRVRAAAASRSRGTRSCTRSRRATGAHTRSRARSRHNPRRQRRAGRGASPTHRSPTPRRHRRASRWSWSRDPRRWWCARRATAPTCGRSCAPTTTTDCCAIVTRSAAWRRSRLLAIASATIASSSGSLSDFSQSSATAPAVASAFHAGGMRRSFGSAWSRHLAVLSAAERARSPRRAPSDRADECGVRAQPEKG